MRKRFDFLSRRALKVGDEKADMVVVADPFAGAVITDVTRAAGIGREGGRDVGDAHRAYHGSSARCCVKGGWNNSWAVRVAKPSPDWLRLP